MMTDREGNYMIAGIFIGIIAGIGMAILFFIEF